MAVPSPTADKYKPNAETTVGSEDVIKISSSAMSCGILTSGSMANSRARLASLTCHSACNAALLVIAKVYSASLSDVVESGVDSEPPFPPQPTRAPKAKKMIGNKIFFFHVSLLYYINRVLLDKSLVIYVF